MTTRRFITAFLRFCLRLFYRRVEVIGAAQVPDGAVVFAANHPNGLVDPLFVLCFAPLAVSFLGKAPLFRYPVIGWFVRTFDTIPVNRRQDGTTGSNAETFARAREVLRRHGSIAIFPEGTTHDDPQLRMLKTGAARIALGAGMEELTIVPTGIYYTAKHAFRSAALVVFGKPFRVRPVVCDSGEPPAADVLQVTSEIEAGLDRVTLQADSHAALDLIARAEDIFSGDERQTLAQEFDIRRRFTEGYHFLRERDPARLEALESKIARFEAELRRARLEVHELRPTVDVTRLFRLLVLLPLAAAGIVSHYVTYRLVDALSHRFAKGEGNQLATIKFIAALAFYPLTYACFATLAGIRQGALAAVATLLLVPFTGYIALRALEELDDVVGDLRAVVHGLFRGYGHRRLIVQRDSIRDEILAVAREMSASAHN